MPPMPKDARPTVVVSALAFRRPEMLRQLLRALAGIDRPEGWRVRFLVVDNDADGSARQVVDECAGLYGDTLDYVIEEAPGIPLARNRALDEATAGGARLLAFIDDDEYPAPDWLVRLVGHYVETGAVLVGGPVRPVKPQCPLSLWRHLVASSLMARARIMERRCAQRARQNRPMLVGTGNWLGDLVWIARNGMRFDLALRYTGGTDTAFLRETLERGGKVSWCEDAVCFEYIEPERISLRYQFRRSRDQAMVHAKLSTEGVLRVCAEQSLRMIIGLVLLVVPLAGAASPTLGIQIVGRSIGRFAGMLGSTSTLYGRSS